MTSSETRYTWQASRHFELAEELARLAGDGLTAAHRESRAFSNLPARERRFFLLDWQQRTRQDSSFGPVRLGLEYAERATQLEVATLQAERRLFSLMASEEEDHAAVANLHAALVQVEMASVSLVGREQMMDALHGPCETACQKLQEELARDDLGVEDAAKKRHRYEASAELREAVCKLYEGSLAALVEHVEARHSPKAKGYQKPDGATLDQRHAAAGKTLTPDARDSWFVMEWIAELRGELKLAERELGSEPGLQAYPARLGRAANRLAGWPENLRDDLVAAHILSEADLAAAPFAEFFTSMESAVWMLEDFVEAYANPLLPHFHLNLRRPSRRYVRVHPPEPVPETSVVVQLPPRQARSQAG